MIRNSAVALIAICGILLMAFYSTGGFETSNSHLTGASILKNKCSGTPETIVAFGSNDNYLYILDAVTGCIISKTDLAGDIRAAVTISDGLIFVGTESGELYAVSFTGEQQASTSLSEGMYGSVAASNTYVYGADASGDIVAYDKALGSRVWEYKTHFSQQDVVYDEEYDDVGAIKSATLYVVEEYLHVGHIIALDALTGESLWKFSAESMIYTAPLVTQDAVFVVSGENTLYRIHKQYGVAQASFATTGKIQSTPIIDENNVLYFGAVDGYFYAVQVEDDGDLVLKWKYYVGHKITARAAHDATHVYFSAQDKRVYALVKETGAMACNFATGKKNYDGPTLFENVLFVPSGDHTFYALDKVTGTELWHYDTDDVLYGEAVVAPMAAVGMTFEEQESDAEDYKNLDKEGWYQNIAELEDSLDVLDTIDSLYSELEEAGTDSTIEAAIDALHESAEAAIETYDADFDDLMSIVSNAQTTGDDTALQEKYASVEQSVEEHLDSVDASIASIREDIVCLADPEEDECEE
jgi:outer membrane protein assembly factor BamB